MLGEGHGAGIEPAVDHLRHALHLLAAVRTGDGHLVHIGAVQLNVLRAVGRQLPQLLNAADSVAMTAFAFPDIQRRAPVAVSADGPILQIFQPVPKPALTDAFGQPVYRVVIPDEFLAHIGHFNIPGFSGIVDQRRIAPPAEGIAVLEFGRGEQQAPLLQILQNGGVRVLAEGARPFGFGGHFSLAVHQLHQGQAVFSAHLGVVLAEGRGNMNHAGAVCQGHVIVAHHVPALFLGAYKIEQGLIFLVLQVRALVLLQNFILAFSQHGIAQGPGQIIGFSLGGNLYIVLPGVDAQRHVGGQRPGGGGPGENEGVLPFHPELSHGGTLLHVLIALGHLVRGKGRAAPGAVGHDLKALIQQTLLPDLL